MARSFNRAAAEQEANEIAFQFQNSNDVIGDMSRAYHTDFSGIRIHTDEAAAERVRAAGTDALAAGRDIFFGRGILGSQEPASKGLLAHELVHTMQQGMAGGEAAEAVSEQVPAGSEQGGFLDFFRSIFKKKPKTEHLGSTKATDEASLAYMAAMKAREQEIFDEKRASALGGVTINANEQALSPELLEESQRANAEVIPESDRLWSDSGSPEAPRTQKEKVSLALMALGHRVSSNDTGRTDKLMREQVFQGTGASYGEYLRNLDAGNPDFQGMNQNKEKYSVEGKSYFINDSIGGMTQDIYSIISQYLLTDSGLDYAENFLGGIQDAKVFQDGAISPVSYMMTTLLTGEGASLAQAMMNNGYGQGNATKAQIGADIRKNLMVPAAMDMIDEEERKVLPPQVQSLYAKYRDIQRQLTEALEARRANR